MQDLYWCQKLRSPKLLKKTIFIQVIHSFGQAILMPQQKQHIPLLLVGRIRVEGQRFPPDEFFYMCFCKRWLLKIKAERCRAGRFFIDVMKRSQVWVMQSLINCMRKEVFEYILKPPLIKLFL